MLRLSKTLPMVELERVASGEFVSTLGGNRGWVRVHHRPTSELCQATARATRLLRDVLEEAITAITVALLSRVSRMHKTSWRSAT